MLIIVLLPAGTLEIKTCAEMDSAYYFTVGTIVQITCEEYVVYDSLIERKWSRMHSNISEPP